MITVIRAGRVIDGTGAPALSDGVVVIADGRIVGVFQGAPPEGFVPPDAEMLEFPGGTILPGLIDTHVHLNLPGNGTTLEVAVRETDGVLVAMSAASARRALDAGITTVRDLGAARGTVFDLRRALQLGYGQGARIVACGQPITITGGHTWYFGGEADGEANLRQKTREMAKLGADFIKVMASGGGTVNTMPWLPSYSPAELLAIADEAHCLGRRVTAHCLCAAASAMVLDAGFDMIEHAGFLLDATGRQEFVPEIAERIARAGIPVTATLAVGGFMIRALKSIECRSPGEDALLERWERMAEANLSQFSRMREAGVRYIAGTDAGWRYTAFEGLWLELELMRQGGMSAAEAIHAATGRAAEVIGLHETVGTLRAGMIADVIVVDGDPLDDLLRLADIRMLMQAGRVHRLKPT